MLVIDVISLHYFLFEFNAILMPMSMHLRYMQFHELTIASSTKIQRII